MTVGPVLAAVLPATGPQAAVARTLLEPWSAYTRAVREEVLSALLARRDRVGTRLAALGRARVNQGQVRAARRTQILANPDRAIKARAEKVFGQNVSGPRTEVVARYGAALGLTGRAVRGADVFAAHCAACHRFAGRGTELGPNLESIQGWDREKSG